MFQAWKLRFGGVKQARRTVKILRIKVRGFGVRETLRQVRNDPYWDGGA